MVCRHHDMKPYLKSELAKIYNANIWLSAAMTTIHTGSLSILPIYILLISDWGIVMNQYIHTNFSATASILGPLFKQNNKSLLIKKYVNRGQNWLHLFCLIACDFIFNRHLLHTL